MTYNVSGGTIKLTQCGMKYILYEVVTWHLHVAVFKYLNSIALLQNFSGVI